MPAVPWEELDLVVFDVDGTLYDQRRLRLGMLRRLLTHAVESRSLHTLQLLRTFRSVRESLGDEQATDFLSAQYTRTAERHGATPDEVRTIATEWLEVRPLDLLAACRYPGVEALFAGLRAAGKQVAVFSDYPAVAKLAAMGLQAHPVVCATDADIGRLKPDPKGLLAVLQRTGVPAGRTLMIGDRFDRDAAVAQRAGVRALIRSAKPDPGVATFRRYDDAMFQPVLLRRRVAATA